MSETFPYRAARTVSRGTLAPRRLYKAFLAALRELNPPRAAKFPDPPPSNPEAVEYLVEGLFDALEACVPLVAEELGVPPERVRFGAPPHDAEHFAYWVESQEG